jgi:hypothetical protein
LQAVTRILAVIPVNNRLNAVSGRSNAKRSYYGAIGIPSKTQVFSCDYFAKAPTFLAAKCESLRPSAKQLLISLGMKEQR